MFSKAFRLLYRPEIVSTFLTSPRSETSNRLGQRLEGESVLEMLTFERIRAVIQKAISNGLPTDALQEEKDSHIQFLVRTRRKYLRKTEDSLIEPSKFLSLIIDKADQSRFANPRLFTATKQQKGHGMAVH